MKSFLLLAVVALAAPSLAQTSDPRIAIMERAAWDTLNRGQAKNAAEIFRQAIASDPNNAGLHFGAAAAAYADRRDDDAKSELDRVLSLEPKHAGAQQLMGNVLRRKGDLLGAIRVYEALVRDTPGDTKLKTSLERLQREFDLSLRQRQTFGGAFTVSFEGPAEEALAVKAVVLALRPMIPNAKGVDVCAVPSLAWPAAWRYPKSKPSTLGSISR